MKELYKLPARPEANRQNILQGDKYRITMLTEGWYVWNTARTEFSRTGRHRLLSTEISRLWSFR